MINMGCGTNQLSRCIIISPVTVIALVLRPSRCILSNCISIVESSMSRISSQQTYNNSQMVFWSLLTTHPLQYDEPSIICHLNLHKNYWVKTFWFFSSVASGEMPINALLAGITLGFPLVFQWFRSEFDVGSLGN